MSQKKETKWKINNSERASQKKNKLNFMHIFYTFVPYFSETNLIDKKKKIAKLRPIYSHESQKTDLTHMGTNVGVKG